MHSYLLGTAGGDIKVIKTAFALKELTQSETDMFASNRNMKQNVTLIQREKITKTNYDVRMTDA